VINAKDRTILLAILNLPVIKTLLDDSKLSAVWTELLCAVVTLFCRCTVCLYA
jgi:hypothetical protein